MVISHDSHRFRLEEVSIGTEPEETRFTVWKPSNKTPRLLKYGSTVQLNLITRSLGGLVDITGYIFHDEAMAVVYKLVGQHLPFGYLPTKPQDYPKTGQL